MCPCNQYIPYNLRRQAKIGEIEEVQGTVGERTSIIHIGQIVTHPPGCMVYTCTCMVTLGRLTRVVRVTCIHVFKNQIRIPNIYFLRSAMTVDSFGKTRRRIVIIY